MVLFFIVMSQGFGLGMSLRKIGKLFSMLQGNLRFIRRIILPMTLN
ncbi:hypothetical protein MTR67_039488 [Solanum verrucosum]|uniref:Uncharacterized protein n=1 Tax=Solanum verrucosum TaxID=315347 RepID=A0AAF0UGZ8_SOLVR|nr:hypothetical protein MTR67_039488 [Solanum verrucosum]